MSQITSIAVNPLNISNNQTYINSFKAPVPKHLGIKVDITWPRLDQQATVTGEVAVLGLQAAIIHLIESTPFNLKYWQPLGVDHCQVMGHGSSTLEQLWDCCPQTRAKWQSNQLEVMVGFYDADLGIREDEIYGFGAAMIVLQECISISGTVDPTLHQPVMLDHRGVKDHRNLVGSIYETGLGVWCEPLIPLWENLMNGSLAYLEAIPKGGPLAALYGGSAAQSPQSPQVGATSVTTTTP